MKFSASTLLITAFAPVALAANPFTAPIVGDILYAGSPFTIKWNNTGGGSTVDLLLRNGSATALTTVLTIAQGIPNNGAAVWSVPSSLSTGAYALEIIADGDNNNVNYTPEFQLINNGTVTPASSTSSASSSGSASVTSSSNSTSSGAQISSNASATRTGSSSASASATSSGDSTAVPSFSTSTRAASSTGASNGASELKLGSAVVAGGLGVAALFL